MQYKNHKIILDGCGEAISVYSMDDQLVTVIPKDLDFFTFSAEDYALIDQVIAFARKKSEEKLKLHFDLIVAEAKAYNALGHGGKLEAA